MDSFDAYNVDDVVYERKSIDAGFFKNKKSITYKNLRKTLNTRYKFFAASINNDSKDNTINPFKSRRPEVDDTLFLSPSTKVDGQTRTTTNVIRKTTQTKVTHSCPTLQIIDKPFVNNHALQEPKRKRKARPKSAGNSRQSIRHKFDKDQMSLMTNRGLVVRKYAWTHNTFGYGNVLYVKKKKVRRSKNKRLESISPALLSPTPKNVLSESADLAKLRHELCRPQSPGPGAYGVEKRTAFGSTVSKYAGVFRKSPATTFIDDQEKMGEILPAPSDYGRLTKPYSQTIIGGIISCSSEKRMTEQVVSDSIGKPGPAYYDLSRQQRIIKGGKFSKGRRRSSPKKARTPGPKYDIPKARSKGHSGLWNCTPKDIWHQQLLRTSAFSPGPDEYQSGIQGKNDEKNNFAAPFGSSDLRFQDHTRHGKEGSGLSSAAYDVVRWPGNEIKAKQGTGTSTRKNQLHYGNIKSLRHMRAEKSDKKKHYIVLPIVELDIQTDPHTPTAAISASTDLEPVVHGQSKLNFIATTSDYESLYWYILEPVKSFEEKISRSLIWIRDVLLRNRVGPSIIRNIAAFDEDHDGFLNAYEFNLFTLYLGLDLNDYQLLWLSRCISPLVNSQYIPLKSFDSFVQYVDRPTSLQAKAMKVIRNRKWIHSWTMQRVHHAKNRVVAQTLLHSHAKMGRLSHNIAQRLVSKVFLTSVFDVSHALIQSDTKNFLVQLVKLNRRAIRIQTSWRRYIEVKTYMYIRNSTTKIQSVVRMFLCRSTYLSTVSNIILLQAYGRMYIASRLFNMKRYSTTQISKTWRKFINRSNFLNKKYQTILLQSIIRMWISKYEFLDRKKKAIKIQSVLRMYKQVIHYSKQLVRIVKIQATFRKYIAQLRYTMKQNGVTQIAKTFRRYKFRKIYLYVRAKILLKQRNVRMWHAYHAFKLTKQKSIQLQAWFRMLSARSRFRKYKLDVIKIQSWIRMKHESIAYKSKRKSAISMEAFSRMVIPRCDWCRLRRSAYRLQTNMRGAVYRRQYLKLKKATVCIQVHVRGHNTRKYFRHIMKLRKELQNNGKDPSILMNNEIVLYKTAPVTVPSGFLNIGRANRKLYMTSYGRIILISYDPKDNDTIQQFHVFGAKHENDVPQKIQIKMQAKGRFEISGSSFKIVPQGNTYRISKSTMGKVSVLHHRTDQDEILTESTPQIYENILYSFAYCYQGHFKWWYEYKNLKVYTPKWWHG